MQNQPSEFAIYGSSEQVTGKIGEDFIDAPYSPDIDDQKHLVVPDTEQKYLTKDYAQFIEYAFPRFSHGSYIPDKYKGQDKAQINSSILEKVKAGENTNWNPKTLSYMRKDVAGKRIMKCLIKPMYDLLYEQDEKMHIVDATTNIGGDSINFAMQKFIADVKCYEILPEVFEMLKNNVELYGLNTRISLVNSRFDYNIPKNSLVVIDPPFEMGNNATNFNLSIERTPIYYVVEKVLQKGAKLVMLNMPGGFKYNMRFARNNNQRISCYHMGNKDVKIFIIGKEMCLPNLRSYRIYGSKRVSTVAEETLEQLYECDKQELK